MTENEAINVLRDHGKAYHLHAYPKFWEAFNLAISALEEIRRRREREEYGESLGVGCMERLTKVLAGSDDDDAVFFRDTPDSHWRCLLPFEDGYEAIKRLAKYEDIGLLPEQIDDDSIIDWNILKKEIEH